MTIFYLNFSKLIKFICVHFLDCYDSILLRCVAHFRSDRLKEVHEKLSTMLITGDIDGDNNAHALKEELKCWENEICYNDNYHFISSMREVSIHFLNFSYTYML